MDTLSNFFRKSICIEVCLLCYIKMMHTLIIKLFLSLQISLKNMHSNNYSCYNINSPIGSTEVTHSTVCPAYIRIRIEKVIGVSKYLKLFSHTVVIAFLEYNLSFPYKGVSTIAHPSAYILLLQTVILMELNRLRLNEKQTPQCHQWI